MPRKKSEKRVKKSKYSADFDIAERNDGIVHVSDIIGVLLIIFGVMTTIGLFMRDSDVIFVRYGTAIMSVLFGYGAFFVPVLLIVGGLSLILPHTKIGKKNTIIGVVIIVLGLLAFLSLVCNINTDEPWRGGGYAGNALAYLLRTFTGDAIGYIVIAGLVLIGALIVINIPISELISRPKQKDALEEEVVPAPKTRLNAIKEQLLEAKADVVPEKPKSRVSINLPRTPSAPVIEAPLPKMDELGEGKDFQLPPSSLLATVPPLPKRVESELKENIAIIERTLEEFKVSANVVEIACGPTVARYEINLAAGIKVNKIVGLADNLAMRLAAIDVRVEAPIPGKAAIGVEVPNRTRGMVVMRDIVESSAFKNAPLLSFALGKDVEGKPKVADLTRMPHLLVGGSTNSGKSVCLSTMIMSILYRATPDQVKLVLIDPKRVELSLFEGIPHLAAPVIKDVKQAAGVLRAVVSEMEKRYEIFSQKQARNLESYNQKVEESERLPYIVVIVDELADLMIQCAAEVEGSITRLAQLARATGIHLIIATQRPSVDVITGIIKANISSRIAFAVSSHHDSRTILDQKGAERLIGRGDMLFLPIDASKPIRVQGCYVSDKEIDATCTFLKAQRQPVYTIVLGQAPGTGITEGSEEDMSDEYYEQSVRFVINTGYCSTSMLQRKFKIGYTRAARIVDTMEQQGIVGPLDGAKPRQVLMSKMEVDALFAGVPMIGDDDYIDSEDLEEDFVE